MHNKYYIHGVKLGCWNIQGVQDYKYDDKIFLDFINQNDVSFFVETWSSNFYTPDEFRSYCVPAASSKHGRSKGGIAVVMKRHVSKGIQFLQHEKSHILWMCLDKYHFKLEKDLYVCVVYMPPFNCYKNNNERDELWESLQNGILKFSRLGNIMLLGDFNSRIANKSECIEYHPEIDEDITCGAEQVTCINRISKDNRVNQFGNRLLDLCCHLNLNILNGRALGDMNGQFTSIHYNGAAVVDYCIVNQEIFPKILYFNVLDPSHLSDHSAIRVCMDGTAKQQHDISETHPQAVIFPKGYRWSESEDVYKLTLQSPQFTNKLNLLNNFCNDSTDVNHMCNEITTFLNDAAKCSLRRSRMKKKNTRHARWYTSSLSGLKNEILNLVKLLKKYPGDPYIRGKFVLKKKEYKQGCRKAKREYFDLISSQLEKFDCKSPRKFWQLLNSMKNKHGDAETVPAMDEFMQSWQNLYQNQDGNEPKNEVVDVMQNPTIHSHINTLDGPINIHELLKAIKGLKNGKSYGSDLIMNEMIKSAATLIEQPLLKLFNMSLESGIYPETWCRGYMVPIFKSGKKSDVNNYRPITASSCLGKLFNTVLNNRLNKFLDENNIISWEQAGFSKGQRAADHILLLKSLIDMYKTKKKHLYACFIDLSSAFDNVWHSGLYYKLSSSGLSGKFVTLLKSMYSQLQCCIKRGDYISQYFNCTKGTRQGCVLSPTLFKIFLNDMPAIINSRECDPVMFNKNNIGCLLYADDILLISQSAKGLQNSINKLLGYCKNWRLSINVRKTKVIIFNSRKKDSVFKLGNKIIDYSDRILYLGYILTPSGKFQAMKKFVYDKANKALFMLRSKLACFPHMTVNCYLKVFDAVIIPKLLYGVEVWGPDIYHVDPKKICINRLLSDMSSLFEIFHSKVCKQILQVNKKSNNIAVRLELGRLPLIVNIICRVLNYFVNLCNRNDSSLTKLSLAMQIQNRSSWYTFIKCVLDSIGISKDNITIYKVKERKSKTSIYNILRNLTEKVYNIKIKECNKMHLYSDIKCNLQRELYLRLQNASNRKFITCIRIGAHNLPVVTGRYANIARENRICSFCKFEIGNELHCIMKCFHPTLVNLRNTFLSDIFKINSNLQKLPRETLFKYILIASDQSIVKVTGQYFGNVMKLFNKDKTKNTKSK